MRKKNTAKKQKPFISLWTVLAMIAVWLLTGCGTPLPALSPKPVQSVQLPPLPSWARQPTTPSECLPTCLDGLTRERGYWQTLLNSGTLPAEPASESTTPPVKN